MRYILIIILLLSLSAYAQDGSMRIDDFSGGLNLTAPKGGLPEGQFLKMTNFIIKGKWLEVRKGLDAWLSDNAITDDPIEYMSLYQTEDMWQVIASDGKDVWVIDDSSDFNTNYYPYNYSEYTCSTTEGDSIIYGNSDSLKWLSIYGYGDYGLQIVIDTGGANDTFTISHILNDTMLIITDTAPNTMADSTFEILTDFGNVHSGITYVKNHYIATDRGLMYWNGNTFNVIDSALEPYKYYVDTLKNSGTGTWLFLDNGDPGCGDCDNWTDGQFNGWYWQYSTGNKFQDTGLARYADHYYKVLNRVNYSAPCSLRVWPDYRDAMMPPWDEWGYLTRREPKYKAGRLTNLTDTDYCIITTRESADSGTVAYWCADTSIGASATIDSAYLESGNISLHIEGVSVYDGYIFFYGGVPVDTIDKWEAFPIAVPWSLQNVSVGDTNYYYTDKNFYFYEYVIDKGGSSADDAYELLEIYRNRLFWKTMGEPNYIYWSEKYDLDSTVSSWIIRTETHDGDWITAIKTLGDFLMIYKKNSILEAFPTNVAFTNQQTYSEFFDYRVATNAIGCIASQTLVSVEETHYFLSNKGFVEFNGRNHRVISDPIEDWLEDSLNLNQLDAARGVYYDGDIYWSLPARDNNDDNDVTFVYHIENGAWTRFDFGAASFLVSGQSEDSLEFFIASPDSGIIAKYSGSDDYGDSIVATLQTDYLDFGIPEKYKFSREIVLGYQFSASKAIGVGLYTDFGSSLAWEDTLTTTGSFGQFRIPCGQGSYGRNLSLELKFYDASGVKIPFLKWFIETMGYAR